ncbi:MAG: DUF3846 domain-containing protein [Clostridia bacterium]|nr:DUF3846 domain-containing protein [Clostridia bacterium]
MNKIMRVVLVEPGKKAVVKAIDGSLECMQKTVGGYIEAIALDDYGTCLVCNENGKIDDLPLNRALVDESGRLTDIIAGTFFVCGTDEEDFASLDDKTAEKYRKRFLLAEEVMRFGRQYVIRRYDPEEVRV